MFHTHIEVTGSGRTDSGVHAENQVAHFNLEKQIPPYALQRGINAFLDPDIRIKEVLEVDQRFHARFSTKGKTYLYRIHTSPYQDPFMRKFATHVPRPLDVSKIVKALPYFVGTKNFLSFTNEGGASEKKRNPVKNLRELTLTAHETGFNLRFTGDGFLYKMVRNITGTLLDIGEGKIAIEDIDSIFEAKNRTMSGKSAPASGLTLIDVEY